MSLRRRSDRNATSRPAPEHARQIVLGSPILSQRKLRQILAIEEVTHEFPRLQYEPRRAGDRRSLRLCAQAETRVREGKLVLLLSDRYLVRGRIPRTPLLVTGAVHQHLLKTGLRCKCNLLIETGTAREPHHFACLIGYGATAVYPYMAYQVLFEMMRRGRVKLDFAARLELGRSYRAGLRKGLFKIMSKMASPPSRAIAARSCSRSWDWRTTWSSCASRAPRAACRARTSTISRPTRRSSPRGPGIRARRSPRRAPQVHARRRVPHVQTGRDRRPPGRGDLGGLRALQAVRAPGERAAGLHVPRPAGAQERRAPDPLAQVEPAEAILARFDGAGMSLGALSPEAHEALAIAMNRLGARSNSGEGARIRRVIAPSATPRSSRWLPGASA